MSKMTDKGGGGVKVRSRVASYGIAVAALATAVLIRWLLDPALGAHLPLVTLFGAVAVAVWVGGYRPALLAAVVGYLACGFLFIEPRFVIGIDSARNLIGLVAYLPDNLVG